VSSDVVVVGGGTAGGVLAARLSQQRSRSVLLLEAGRDFGSAADRQPREVADALLEPGSDCDWGHTGVATGINRSVPLKAGRIVGGSSAINRVMALRGHPTDYDGWADAGCRGWSFREVLSAFRRLERDLDFGEADTESHGTCGPIPIRRYHTLTETQEAFLLACEATGHPRIADHNAPGAVGAGPLPVNELAGVRQSTTVTYLAECRDQPNLTIRAGAQVDRVMFDHNGRVTGLRLVGGEYLETDTIVLAAGTYGTPAILLRSGIGPAAELSALGIPVGVDLPGVGANLHDHPLLRIRFVARGTPSLPPRQTLLTARSHPDAPAPDLQVFPTGLVPGDEPDSATFTLLVALLAPHSRGCVRLSAPRPQAPLLIQPAYLSASDDLRRLIAGVGLARAVAKTPPLAGYLIEERWAGADIFDDDELVRAVRADVMPYHHPVGTARMGHADDPGAVVDRTGRVHGVTGLHVVDASIMPTIPSANTNVATLMIAEHLAPHLSSW
jgi:choline dehydrogenase